MKYIVYDRITEHYFTKEALIEMFKKMIIELETKPGAFALHTDLTITVVHDVNDMNNLNKLKVSKANVPDGFKEVPE